MISAEGERSEFGKRQSIVRHLKVVFGRNFDECIILLGAELFFLSSREHKGSLIMWSGYFASVANIFFTYKRTKVLK